MSNNCFVLFWYLFRQTIRQFLSPGNPQARSSLWGARTRQGKWGTRVKSKTRKETQANSVDWTTLLGLWNLLTMFLANKNSEMLFGWDTIGNFLELPVRVPVVRSTQQTTYSSAERVVLSQWDMTIYAHSCYGCQVGLWNISPYIFRHLILKWP